VVGSLSLYNGGCKNKLFKGNLIIGSTILVVIFPYGVTILDASHVSYPFPFVIFGD